MAEPAADTTVDDPPPGNGAITTPELSVDAAVATTVDTGETVMVVMAEATLLASGPEGAAVATDE